MSAILLMVVADVDPGTRQVRARGSKAWARDRLTRVADWAWLLTCCQHADEATMLRVMESPTKLVSRRMIGPLEKR